MTAQPEKFYGYEETLMHGQYTHALRDYAKEYAKKLKYLPDDEFSAFEGQDASFRSYSGKHTACWQLKYFWHKARPILANDYSFLLILGVAMAIISFSLDYLIQKCQMAQILLYQMVNFNSFLQYVLWVGFPLLLIIFAVGFVHIVSPHAIGSGIPEMKVILRGTILKRYLSFPTFIAKMVGLLAALGSGIPIGKEGPFVHISSMVARLLSKFIKGFQGIYVNESRNTDMLACACALGVSSSFAAPIGGVLFSIEVTSTYFAVRNYWKGFFTAVCGAFMFRLLAVLDAEEETITALFKTNFSIEFPFDVQEFVAFAFIGLTCGLAGALFVYTHRKIVDVSHQHENSKVTRFLKRSRFLYPAIIVVIVSTLSFPKGFGQFMAGQLTAREAISELFSNSTWSAGRVSESASEVLQHWDTGYSNIYITLVVFIITKFLLTAICVALPIPAGVFFPVFVIGAAYGRLVGECMATWFPDGVRSGETLSPVVPGGYAVVGAAALAGAVTHTISTSVIVFELTGQITHILPVMVAVLIANSVVQQLQPSIYDSIIEIKKLPHLPDIRENRDYHLCAGDIMNPVVYFTTTRSTYMQLKKLLAKTRLSSYALVDNPDSMVLLGSIRRPQLEWLLDRQLSRVHDDGNTVDINTDTVQADAGVAYNSNTGTATIPTDSSDIEAGGRKSPLRPKKKTKKTSKGSGTGLQNLFNSSTEGGATSEDGNAEYSEWEQELFQEQINFTGCHIDPSPFQLVEQTPLYKIHKLFNLLNVYHAYVTSLGRLVGVVSLKEMRRAIEDSSQFDQRRRARSRLHSGITESENDFGRSSLAHTLSNPFESNQEGVSTNVN